ncbi:MAG: polysaccharide pyruvyl transferase family protein [Pseudomonadota bacterium]
MTSQLKVLHIASFIGNIGDNAMHDGAYRTRAEDLDACLSYDKLEIREFIHWKTRRFDSSFVKDANKYDAIIVGGDSLLQMWREDTPTGTYVDAKPDFFDLIERPVCFYGLGVDATRGVSPNAMSKCRGFLDKLMASDKRLFSVRDDESINFVRDHIGKEFAQKFEVISDGGLFCLPDHHEHACIPQNCDRFVIVNLAGDMPEKRFQASERVDKGLKDFCRKFASGLSELLRNDQGLGCVFVPHIHSDLAIISQTMSFMDDLQRRTRVGVAPYLQGEAWSAGFDLYRHAAVVIAMRFHANLVPLGLGTPTIGISTHHKVEGLYRSFELADRCVEVKSASDLDKTFSLAASTLANEQAGLKVRQKKIYTQKRRSLADFHNKMNVWLEQNA